MRDEEALGDDFEKKAEKKLGGLGILGYKYEDIAEFYEKYEVVIDLYEKAAKCYELAKTWEKAAALHIKLAGLHSKAESRHDAATSYVDAAYSYKKYSMPDAARALNEAVSLYSEIGQLNMAASYCKELSESFEASHDLKNAMDYFERAADLFQRAGVSNSVNSCMQRAAQLAAQLEQYPKAVEIFEEVAQQSMNNNLLKYSVRGILLNAGICQLCKNDPVAITNSLERYQEIDPTFSGTREYKLLADLATSMEEEDNGKFTGAIHEYDNMTCLDTLFLKFWREYWSLKGLQPKVRVFGWRLFSNALPLCEIISIDSADPK